MNSSSAGLCWPDSGFNVDLTMSPYAPSVARSLAGLCSGCGDAGRLALDGQYSLLSPALEPGGRLPHRKTESLLFHCVSYHLYRMLVP